jgi:hypothetical protein
MLPTVSRRNLMAAGAAALVGPPRPRTYSERLLAACPRPNVYQRSFLKFWNDLVWTADEARAGEVRKAPAWPMFRDLEEDLLTERLLFLDKARRVMASWFVCGFDVWLLAGGQDPRWPALMRSRNNRQIILASRKKEDIQGSQWFLERRVQFIYEQLRERGIEKHWPGFPVFTFNKDGEGWTSTGSYINAVPQGKDQCRGPGATFLHFEEVAAWEQAQPSIESAKMTLLASEGFGGHICCLSTAAVGTYAADIVLDQINKRGWR